MNIIHIMIKVFNIGDLIKYIIKILMVIITIFFLMQFFTSKVKKNNTVSEKNMLFCIDEVLPAIKVSSNKKENINIPSTLKYALSSELEVLDSIKQEEALPNNEEIENENVQETKSEDEVKVEQVQDGATVTEVDNSGVNPRSTDDFKGVRINNGTEYTLTAEMLEPNVEINKDKVAIYHTHTCESYTPTEEYKYEASGAFRTIDLNYSVARVGDELTKQLESYNRKVIHDKTYHDYPSYNGSYSRSLVTAQNILSSQQDTDIVIDLHRDAIADETYAPKVKIGDEYVSQLMFVIGSDGAGSEHKNWIQNLKFAIKVQQKANEMYPGLFKPIILRNSDYNQSVAKAACIIEVGSTGNTLEESMGAMKYLAKILEEI